MGPIVGVANITNNDHYRQLTHTFSHGNAMKIGLVVYSGCMTSGLFSFADLLEVANRISGKQVFEMYWVGEQGKLEVPLSSSRSTPPQVMQITPKYKITDLDLQAILLPGMWINSVSELKETLKENQALLETLRCLKSSVDIYGYCSSVSFLAHTNRLKNQQATSTWWLANYFQQEFTDVDWRFNKTLVTGKNHTTASGVNGHLPIAMHLVEKHCGKKVLRDVTRIMLLPRPETVQHPFQKVDILALNDSLMRKIHYWVEKTPAYQLNLSSLSSVMNITERTITRKIKLAIGESAMSFIRLIKLNQASEHLILSNKPISEISEELGYLDDRVFRRSFKRVTAYTPIEYRETFKRNPLSTDT